MLPRYKKIQIETRIGDTRLAELPAPGIRNRIFAKLEYENPGGSHYDRVYLHLLSKLEGEGVIMPGVSTLVESTSGNAGISCAFLARLAGYQCMVFFPKAREICTPIIDSYGAESVVINGHCYMADVRDAMANFLKDHRERISGYRKYYSPNHSQEDVSYQALAPIVNEVLASVDHIDCFFGVAGNGSTLRGMGSILKGQGAKVYALEPQQAPVASRLKYGRDYSFGSHSLYGAGVWGIPFPHLEYAIHHLIDEVFLIRDHDWEWGQEKLLNLGYRVGRTSSASYRLAWQWCEKRSDQKVLIIFYDPLERY